MNNYKDLPRDIAIGRAEELRLQGWDVHFKFTCGYCGSRVALREANTLYEKGECFLCGQETPLERVGFMLVRGFLPNF